MTEPTPHPREVFDYLGGEQVEAAFVDAIQRRRLHHAWLLTGPPGVGKATFAYRAARRLLGAEAYPDLGPLGAAPDDPVCRQIIARAHPDLLALQRDPEDGRARKGIPVEEARGLPEFFAKSPANAPHRVAIIDAADDLNPFGANAVLKTLEEPPERGVLLLVCNSPGRLLPTLRSRCRRLNFHPPDRASVQQWLIHKAAVGEGEADRLVHMAHGSPGRAWWLAAQGGLEIDDVAREIIAKLPGSDGSAMLKLSDSFRGSNGPVRFQLVFERLAERARMMANTLAGVSNEPADLPQARRWAEVWRDLVSLPRDAEALNLDRADTFYTALSRLRAIA